MLKALCVMNPRKPSTSDNSVLSFTQSFVHCQTEHTKDSVYDEPQHLTGNAHGSL